MTTLLSPSAIGVTALAAAALHKIRTRLQLSRAKHPSLSGHARLARRVSRQVPFYEYDEETFFSSDAAPAEIVARRRAGFARLARDYQARCPETLRLTQATELSLSDLQFTSAYRVPFQYRGLVRRQLGSGAFVKSTRGIYVCDLDDNEWIDLTGSYGVNLFGHEFYKSCLRDAQQRAGDLGAVLGPYHPLLASNVARLKAISGLDEVSFHMSGTEAVMQAVRLARYHTGRSHLVRFCGAYHGWWGDVQPGVGNPTPARETYTLEDMSEGALRVLRTRKDIACVLINPLQALHPNQGAPSDSMLVAGRKRPAYDRAAYGRWLQALQRVCSERNIVLIFDEVFMGFRLAPGGAQQYFGVRADMVTYGKTLGGGLPVGVLCGRRHLMKRYRDDRPTDICFARGTFNSHPYVMAAMHAFLEYLDGDGARAAYRDLDASWDRRAAALNQRLQAEGLPVSVANMSSIWTVCYPEPSRYHWMFQYYLRDQGLLLSWVGTGRLIFSIDFTEQDFQRVADKLVAAARAMKEDGWWWSSPRLTQGSIRRQILSEMIRARLRAR